MLSVWLIHANELWMDQGSHWIKKKQLFDLIFTMRLSTDSWGRENLIAYAGRVIITCAGQKHSSHELRTFKFRQKWIIFQNRSTIIGWHSLHFRAKLLFSAHAVFSSRFKSPSINILNVLGGGLFQFFFLCVKHCLIHGCYKDLWWLGKVKNIDSWKDTELGKERGRDRETDRERERERERERDRERADRQR